MTRERIGLVARIAGFALLVGVVAWLPNRLSDFRASQLALVAIYLCALLGLNVLIGFNGQISLGHGAFMAIGGYTTAVLVSDQGLHVAGHTFSSDMRDIWTIPIAGLVAGIAGVLFGIPALRLSGLYLALATFAVAVALPQVLKKFEGLTGGSTGINLFGLPRLSGLGVEVRILGRTLTYNDWLYYLSWTWALALLVVAWALLRGRTGRALRAIRDSELAAASSGVNLSLFKTLAFGVSAFYAGVAGSLFALSVTFVNPEVFPITLSIFLLVGVVVGGLGSLWPLVGGALFIVYVRDLTDRAAEQDWLPGFVGEFLARPGARDVVFGAALILVMFLLPTGLGGLISRGLGALTNRLYTRSQPESAAGTGAGT
jgi:branched-chain amino acid transport system permease protein